MGRDSEKGKYTSPNGSPIWEYMSVLTCSINTFGHGLSVGWTSPALAKLMALDSPIPMGPNEASTMAAIPAVALILAPLTSAPLIDRIGRKNTMLLSALPLIISWILIIVAADVMILYIARFMAGLAFGLNMHANSIYLGEILSLKLRGRMAMMTQIMFNVGLVFMMLIGSHIALQLTAFLGLAVAAIYLLIFFFMPESPYYLVMSQKFEEAEAALEKLRGKMDVAEELQLIKASINIHSTNNPNQSESSEKSSIGDKSKPTGFKLLFTVAGNRKAMYIIMLFMLHPHVSGYGSILVYGHLIFTDMGTQIPVDICLLIFTVSQAVVIVATSIVVDKLGRRPLVCVSGVVSCICLGIISTYFYMLEYLGMDVTRYSMIPLGAVFLLAIALGSGLDPVCGVVCAEVFSINVKALAQCFMCIYAGILGTIATKIYLIVVKSWNLGHSVPFFAFTVIIGIATALLMSILPETKGKTLLQIQTELNT